MRLIYRSLGWLAAIVLASVSLGVASASAFEAHNFLEPPLGPFGEIEALAVDQATGDVYVTDGASPSGAGRVVDVFGATGGAPAAGPSSFTGAGIPAKEFAAGEELTVDNACYEQERLTGEPLSVAECEAFDTSNGDIYVGSYKYRLNGSGQYEYLNEAYGGRCGTIDPAGNLDVVYKGEGGVAEYNSVGEGEFLRLLLPSPKFTIEDGNKVEIAGSDCIARTPGGTIYARVFDAAREGGEVVELKRSSLTGPVEGEPVVVPNTVGAKSVAFDQASGQLFVDLGSSGEALNAAHEVVSRFGAGVMAKSEEIAVDEATGEVYAASSREQVIDRFGPGVEAALPTVDAPPPSLSSITRTSALLSATIGSQSATTKWKLEYVPAAEYQPGAANPYAAGGSTALAQIAPAAQGTAVGPLPLTGLLAGTTYDYRLVASNEVGSTYGPQHTFTTAAATPPIVTTGAAAEVAQTGVLLTGTVNTRELQTSYEFEVGTRTASEGATLFGNAGSGGVEAVSASLQFLIPGVTYHYRLLASNEDGTTYGQDMTFTTPGVLQPISQPVAEAFVPSPTVQFPSVAGAISKPVGSGKSSKKKAKTKKKSKTKRKKKGGKQGKGRKASVGRRSGTAASTGTHARGGGKGK